MGDSLIQFVSDITQQDLKVDDSFGVVSKDTFSGIGGIPLRMNLKEVYRATSANDETSEAIALKLCGNLFLVAVERDTKSMEDLSTFVGIVLIGDHGDLLDWILDYETGIVSPVDIQSTIEAYNLEPLWRVGSD